MDSWNGEILMGKGDKQRIPQVSTKEITNNWVKALGKRCISCKEKLNEIEMLNGDFCLKCQNK